MGNSKPLISTEPALVDSLEEFFLNMSADLVQTTPKTQNWVQHTHPRGVRRAADLFVAPVSPIIHLTRHTHLTHSG